MKFQQETLRFLRCIKRDLGPETATKALHALVPILGQAWMDNVFKEMLINGLSEKTNLIVTHIPHDKTIAFVKILRTASDVSLVEAKMKLDEFISSGHVEFIITNMDIIDKIYNELDENGILYS